MGLCGGAGGGARDVERIPGGVVLLRGKRLQDVEAKALLLRMQYRKSYRILDSLPQLRALFTRESTIRSPSSPLCRPIKAPLGAAYPGPLYFVPAQVLLLAA